MPWVQYVAAESVIPLHISGTSYAFSFRVQRADESVEILKKEQRSLSGKKETLYFGKLSTWNITLEPIPTSEANLIREFLDSTANGQSFTFDPYGTISAPVRPLLVNREDMGYDVVRKTQTGDPAYSDYLEFSFKLCEVA